MIKNRKEELLEMLTEECAEIIQVKSKICRFGFDSYPPGGGYSHQSRLAHLHEEIADLLNVIDLLYQEEVLEETTAMELKPIKIEKRKKHMLFHGEENEHRSQN